MHILKEALDKNIKAKIINENNEIQLINTKTTFEKNEEYKYISVIPLTTEARGVTISGMKYLLENYNLSIGRSLGVSNEQVEAVATIDVKEGVLIIIKSKD